MQWLQVQFVDWYTYMTLGEYLVNEIFNELDVTFHVPA